MNMFAVVFITGLVFGFVVGDSVGSNQMKHDLESVHRRQCLSKGTCGHVGQQVEGTDDTILTRHHDCRGRNCN